MACFTVPVAEAILTTAAEKIIRSREKAAVSGGATGKAAGSAARLDGSDGKISFSVKLGWLNKMLWGGSALLAFEHVWHGEVVPFFPFLTAVKDGEVSGMLREMATAGVGMAVLVTAVWGIMVAVSSALEKAGRSESGRAGSPLLAGGLA
ncbi:MAG: hypothetical protein ILP18_02905 [Treponema sp.]|nr:hypothetical protein [Treponema sp.]